MAWGFSIVFHDLPVIICEGKRYERYNRNYISMNTVLLYNMFYYTSYYHIQLYHIPLP